MFAVLDGYRARVAHRHAARIRRGTHWDLFAIGARTTDEPEVYARAARAAQAAGYARIDWSEPERCDDKRAMLPYQFDDLDAALRYLASGGALIKTPDFEGSPHWRLYVCVADRAAHKPRCRTGALMT